MISSRLIAVCKRLKLFDHAMVLLFDHDGSVAIHTSELDSSEIGLIVESDLNVNVNVNAWMRTEIDL